MPSPCETSTLLPIHLIVSTSTITRNNVPGMTCEKGAYETEALVLHIPHLSVPPYPRFRRAVIFFSRYSFSHPCFTKCERHFDDNHGDGLSGTAGRVIRRINRRDDISLTSSSANDFTIYYRSPLSVDGRYGVRGKWQGRSFNAFEHEAALISCRWTDRHEWRLMLCKRCALLYAAEKCIIQ